MALLRVSILSLCAMLTAWAEAHAAPCDTCVVPAANEYATARLERLARALGIDSVLDTIADGDHRDMGACLGRPVSAAVHGGVVDHIGVSVFAPRQRQSAPSLAPIFNFVERYVLESSMPGEEAYSFAHRIDFTDGTPSMLGSLSADTAVTVSVTLDAGKRYAVAWLRDDTSAVCRMEFPASYELIHGSKMIENERRLSRMLACYQPADSLVLSVDVEMLEPADTLGLMLLPGGWHNLPQVRGDTYYTLTADSTAVLVRSEAYPIETMANMLLTRQGSAAARATVNMIRYDFGRERIELPLSSLVGYFLDEGCHPYMGIMDFDPATGRLTAMVKMVNEPLGYLHMLKARTTVADMLGPEPHFTITLTSYIPTHNISNENQ